ncbi:MAG TPA: LLM class flavin-dependent oxidoreductase [Thermomicrobiales bacterium]|nr:LLM class flavin-dependent oxidoreductase [Thermomicrobiales bacterium]
MTQSLIGFGIAGALDHAVVRTIAPRLEAAGFATLWVNDTPDGDSLRSLAAAAEVTSSLHLATGVISVDRRPVEEIISAVHRLDLPQSRLTVGIGSSAPPSPLSRIEASIDALHRELASRVMVGALGPRMRRVAVVQADGALLNWLTPDAARRAVADMEQAVEGSGGRRGHMALYVRTALGDAAGARLEVEAERYAGIKSYAANFRRLGVRAIDTAIRSSTPAGIRDGIARYDGTLDEIVIRAITAKDTIEEYLELMDAVMGRDS